MGLPTRTRPASKGAGSNEKEVAIPPRLRINDQIRVTRVRLIDQDGKQVGVLPTEEALNMARAVELDLVEVSPTADPPVCKILDFGKFLYKQRKKEHEAKRKQVVVQIKEIRLRPKTDTHDRKIKLERAQKFLLTGNRVQVNMLFRGREMAHMDLGRRLLQTFAEDLEELAKVDSMPSRMGRRMTMLLAPRPRVVEAHRKEKREAAERQRKESGRQKRVSSRGMAVSATEPEGAETPQAPAEPDKAKTAPDPGAEG